MGFTKTSSDQLQLPKGAVLLQQTYDKEPLPNGALTIKLSVFTDDQGGWFRENFRQDENGYVIALKEQGVNFKFVQTNTNYLAPWAKRFWHIHPAKGKDPGQNEIWVTSGILLVGLVDLRKGSPTFGIKSKVVLSPEKALYIPAGVAHGFINPTNQYVTLIYFVDRFFVAGPETQEHRISPTTLPYDFVEPETM